MSAEPARAYLGIGEVLAQLHAEFPDVSVSKIRFLETEGLIQPAQDLRNELANCLNINIADLVVEPEHGRYRLGEGRFVEGGLREADREALELATGQDIGGVCVQSVLAVGAQEADALLIREKAQRTLGEVKQRAEARISLGIVVAVGAFIIASQLSDAVVDVESPIVREGFADFEFDRFVFTLRVFVGVWFAVGIELTTEGSTSAWRLALFEVGAVRHEDVRWICCRNGQLRIVIGIGH